MGKAAKKILVVDDDCDIREVITTILELEGYTVAGLDNGLAVLDIVQEMQPDLMLLDVMLGDLDGRDICRELKRAKATSGIPIIIVSATHGRNVPHGQQCGADEYLDKPFDTLELVSQVKRYAA